MSPDEKILAESIRSGKYFEDSRHWFRTIYIGPISERAFYLVIALFSAAIAFASVVALFSLLPLNDHRPVLLYAGDRINETDTKLTPLKTSNDELDHALIKFFVTHYVRMRESYFSSTYLSNALFVRQQSSDAIYAAYTAQNDASNPASPAATLGQFGKRFLTIRSVRADENDAVIKFTTEDEGVGGENKTDWTARIEFVYTGIEVGEKKNAETGDLELTTTDPKFQVVKYELEQK